MNLTFRLRCLKINGHSPLLLLLEPVGSTWVVFPGSVANENLNDFWLKLKLSHRYSTPEGGASAGTITVKSVCNEIFKYLLSYNKFDTFGHSGGRI